MCAAHAQISLYRFFVVIVLLNINTHVHIRICNFVNISNCWEGG